LVKMEERLREKVIGQDEILKAEMGKFRSFVQSIRFSGDDSGEISWELPDGWQEIPATGIRYATLRFGPADDPLELAVTALPNPTGNAEDFMLANINRWRRQMGVTPISVEELPAAVERIPLEAVQATVVSFPGRTPGDGTAVSTVEEKGNAAKKPAPRSAMEPVQVQPAGGVPDGK